MRPTGLSRRPADATFPSSVATCRHGTPPRTVITTTIVSMPVLALHISPAWVPNAALPSCECWPPARDAMHAGAHGWLAKSRLRYKTCECSSPVVQLVDPHSDQRAEMQQRASMAHASLAGCSSPATAPALRPPLGRRWCRLDLTISKLNLTLQHVLVCRAGAPSMRLSAWESRIHARCCRCACRITRIHQAVVVCPLRLLLLTAPFLSTL